jgi:hypothetical protein
MVDVINKRAPNKFLPHTAMADSVFVFPGEPVPAKHVNLKLGPGLLSTPSGVVTTKAGQLVHSPNRAKWWVQTNARRVSSTVL